MHPTKYRVVLDDDTILLEADTLEEAECFLLRALNEGEDAYLQTPEDYADDSQTIPQQDG